MKNKVYWWEIKENLEPQKAKELPKKVDFLIIGAGYTGLSASLTIAKKGKSVVVLDSTRPGYGASTRNGGICSGQIRLSHQYLKKKFGLDFANEVYTESVEARQNLINFCKEEKINCQLQMSGRFTGAMCQIDYDNQLREADSINNIIGHNAYMISKKDQYKEISSNLFCGGMIREEIGGFHPAKFFSGLLNSAQKSGALIFSNTKVFDITSSTEGEKIITTNSGIIKAKNIIVASNAYTEKKEKFGKFLIKRIVPVKSAIIVTEKLGKDYVKKLIPKLRMCGNTANLYSYFRPTPDHNRILLGSRALDKKETSFRTLKYLKGKLTMIFPDLKNCKIDFFWEGNVGFTRSQLPVIFEHENVFYVAGYAGSGTVWATWLGKKVAEIVLKSNNKRSIFFGPPPKSFPLYNGDPWFLPTIQYYFTIKDWIKARR